MKPAIVVVGSLNMDFVVRTPRLPAPNETALGGNFRMTPAARLAARSVVVRMIGRVGQYSFADHLRARLAGAGIDVAAVHASKSQPTGVAFIAVDAAGQNQIVVAPGANPDLQPGDVGNMRHVFRGARLALFQLGSPLPTVTSALRLAREEGLRTILDPAPARTRTRKSPPPLRRSPRCAGFRAWP